MGPQIATLLNDYNDGQSIEAKIAHDADQIELLLVLKELLDLGNPRAQKWFDQVITRVHTPMGQMIAHKIANVPSDQWWTPKNPLIS